MTPGWDSPAYVSCLALALRQDCQPDSHRDHGAQFAEYMSKIRCKIERNRSIKEIAIQKQLCSILISKIHNGWNPLVSKRLGDYGIESALIHDSLEFFKLKLKKIQPHLRMSFVKTLTNGWHTSSRMHEAICLPCIFECNSLPINSISTSDSRSSSSCRPIKDEVPTTLIVRL